MISLFVGLCVCVRFKKENVYFVNSFNKSVVLTDTSYIYGHISEAFFFKVGLIFDWYLNWTADIKHGNMSRIKRKKSTLSTLNYLDHHFLLDSIKYYNIKIYISISLKSIFKRISIKSTWQTKLFSIYLFNKQAVSIEQYWTRSLHRRLFSISGS